LVNLENSRFETKLRHIDIHNHWVRQEARAGRVAVRWVPTGKIVADGLTKLLPRQKHEEFVRLLRMRTIDHMISDS
jgi:hypothetical protein